MTQSNSEDKKIAGGSVGVSQRRSVAPPSGSSKAGSQVRTKTPPRPKAGGSRMAETSRSRWGDVTIDRENLKILPQFRKTFDPVDIEELADSMAQIGLLMPVAVYEDPDGKGYILAAGERRIRAIDLLATRGIKVPIRAIVRSKDDAILIQLHENTQRVELNKLEIAASYRWLQLHDPVTRELRDEPLSVRKLADLVNKGHDSVFHYLRLASLSDPVVELMEEKIISSPRTLDNIQRLFGEGYELIGLEVCAQCRDGNIMQRDAIARILSLLQEGKVSPKEMLTLIQTRGLTQTKTVDALIEVVNGSSDASRAIDAVLHALKNNKDVTLLRCIQDAQKHLNTAPPENVVDLDGITGQFSNDSVSHDKQLDALSDNVSEGEASSLFNNSTPSQDQTGEDDDHQVTEDTNLDSETLTAPSPPKQELQTKASHKGVLDAIPSGRVVSKESGRSGFVVAIKVKWDDGEESEVTELIDLRLSKTL